MSLIRTVYKRAEWQVLLLLVPIFKNTFNRKLTHNTKHLSNAHNFQRLLQSVHIAKSICLQSFFGGPRARLLILMTLSGLAT